MSRDAASGALLIAGGIAAVVVMGFHPTAHALMNEETFAHTALVNMVVHGLAIAAAPVLFLGLLGVSRRIGHPDLAIAGLVAFGFGTVAVLDAALASGFVFTGVLRRIAAEEGADPQAFLIYTTLWNQAFAKVHLVAHAIGTTLLSAAVLGKRTRLPHAAALGVAGIVVSAAILLLFFSGHVRLDVHGARLIWFFQAGWLAWLGAAMCSRRGRGDEAHGPRPPLSS